MGSATSERGAADRLLAVGFGPAVRPGLGLSFSLGGDKPLIGSRQQGEHPMRHNGRESPNGMAAPCPYVPRPARGPGQRVTLGLAVQVGDLGLRHVVLDGWMHVVSPVMELSLSRGCG